MSDQPTVRVAAGVIRNQGKYLLTRRMGGTHMAGYWEFPGGKLEERESPGEALVRELREELGVDVETGETLASLEHEYPEKRVALDFILARIIEGRPRALEVAEWGWFAPSQMLALPILPADGPVVELLLRREKGVEDV